MAIQPSPLVSVITAFYNEARFLSEAVQSVLAQTYPHWQLWLVDDGSTDASTEMARSYAQAYPGRIFYLEHPGHANRGLSASRNLGIAHAEGELIAIIDADDVWRPEKLAQQVGQLRQHPQAAMTCCAAEFWFDWQESPRRNFVNPVGLVPDRLYAPPNNLLLKLYPLGKGATPSPSTWLIKKSAVLRHGGFNADFSGDYQAYEDQVLLCKLYLNEPIYVSSACYLRYRQRSGSLVHRMIQQGTYFKVRLYYLNWVRSYLESNGKLTPRVAWRLRRHTFLCRHPEIDRFKKYAEHYIRRFRQKVKKIAQRCRVYKVA